MKTGYFRNDFDGRWYLIPEDKIDLYDEISDELESAYHVSPGIWEQVRKRYIDEFDQYRISGYSISHIKVSVDSDIY